MLRKLLPIALLALTVSTTQAGLFDLSTYYTGGTLTQGDGFVDFDENGGSATAFDAGDVVYFIQEFTNVTGTGAETPAKPLTVFGITALKAKSGGKSTTSVLGSSTSVFDLEATGTFGTYLSNLGISTADVTIGASSAFALISSSSNVTLNSNGTTDFSSFEVDLVAGFDGVDDFAEATIGNTDFFYDYYNPSVNTPLNAFGYKIGFTVESTDDNSGFNNTSANDFAGNSSNVTTRFLGASATSLAQNYGASPAYYGSLDGDISMLSTVPEPSSLAVFGLVGFSFFVSRRRK